jgi:hypothetical protein
MGENDLVATQKANPEVMGEKDLVTVHKPIEVMEEKDLVDLPESDKCMICWERVVNTRNIPCNHAVMCSVCAVKINVTTRGFECTRCLRQLIGTIHTASCYGIKQ